MAMRQVVVGIQKRSFIESKLLYLKQKVKNIYPSTDIKFVSVNTTKEIKKVEILVTDATFLIEALPDFTTNIKWVQLTWAGWEDLRQAVEEFNDHSIKRTLVTRLGNVFAQPTAEYVLGAVISIERGFHIMKQDQKKKLWNNPVNFTRIHGFRDFKDMTIGILGLGQIGLAIARAFKDLGMTVYGLASSQKNYDTVAECFTKENLDKFLTKCDYICNALPSTPATANMLSGPVLESCKVRKPAFINIGRGDIIKEKHLVNALQKNWISHAFLDVFEKEPLPETSELWHMENVTITPHVSSISGSNCYEDVFIDNLNNYINDK